MVLNTSDDQNKPVAESNMQFLVVAPEPAAVMFTLTKNRYLWKTDFQRNHAERAYTYQVRAPMYRPDAGVIKLSNTPVTKSVALKPKFGYMDLLTTRAGCRRIHRQRTVQEKLPYHPVTAWGSRNIKVRIEKQTPLPDRHRAECNRRRNRTPYLPHDIHHQTESSDEHAHYGTGRIWRWRANLLRHDRFYTNRFYAAFQGVTSTRSKP